MILIIRPLGVFQYTQWHLEYFQPPKKCQFVTSTNNGIFFDSVKSLN